MPRTARLPQIVLTTVLACSAAAGLARADSYRWVDHDGNVHLTQDPPPPGAAVHVQHEGGEDSAAAPRRTASDTSSRGSVPRYSGKRPSRRITLEKMGLQIPSEQNAPASIGQACGRSRNASHASSWANGISFASGFYGRLGELGYETPQTNKLRFSNESESAPELAVIGVIQGLQVQGCARISNLRVQWRIFDNLQRRVVYENTTSGTDTLSDSEDPRQSMLEAFVAASNALFADAQFRALMTPRSPAARADDGPGALDAAGGSLQSLALGLRYPARLSTFRDSVPAIKEASVTVRTAGGHGSGFVVSEEGHVLTNHHVVRGNDRVLVLIGEREIEATPIRVNALRDIALLQLSTPPGVKPLPLARKQPVEGDTLYVVGTPLDESLDHTVTRGILSAVRTMDSQRFYQTDAAVNPGNSGGPALDAYGQVVAVTVAGTFTKDGGAMNINLLIPIEDALRGLQIQPR